jgi:hypothetical protein
METTIIDESQIENILKRIIVELLENKNEKFFQIINEAIEDFAIGQAIKEGLSSEIIPESDIWNELRK